MTTRYAEMTTPEDYEGSFCKGIFEGLEPSSPHSAIESLGALDFKHNASTDLIRSNSNVPSFQSSYEASYEKLHFPPLFSTSFGPTTLLYSSPILTNPMSYGEGVSGGCAIGFSIMRPTIELPLDELLEAEERMAEAYAQAHTHSEDAKKMAMTMSLDGSISTATTNASSSEQLQDILISDSHQHQPQQPQPLAPYTRPPSPPAPACTIPTPKRTLQQPSAATKQPKRTLKALLHMPTPSPRLNTPSSNHGT
ncbi:hypothetical protein M405DRAFT_893703 [Rhizopogon salebrosus TDB-379]|nr:hypothetical protein M405DRAFT_893703 [Rhizopogon salebrosus TDB-379]